MVLFHFIDQMFENIISGVISKKKILGCSPNSVHFSLCFTHPSLDVGVIAFILDLIRNTHAIWKTLSWPLLSSSTVQLLSEDKTSWQPALFLFALIWNASSWISFKCNISGAKHAGTFVNGRNQNACVLGRVFVTIGQNLCRADFLFISRASVCFGCAPHKADYVLAVLQTRVAKTREHFLLLNTDNFSLINSQSGLLQLTCVRYIYRLVTI